MLKEIAEERGAKYVRIELGSLEEIGDLLGVPVKEFIMYDHDGNEQWVTEKLIEEYLALGYKLCSDCAPRMGYAIPSWVPKDDDQEVVLVLDDYSRASGLFMQAIMSLIQFGEYISWKLPKKTHLLLTSNEDNGSMSVTTLDSAQQTRLINFHLEFNNEQYCAWLDKNNAPDVLVNFALLHGEIFEQCDTINARTYTMFANALNSITNFNSLEALDTVDLIARGCFGKDTNIGALFVTFVDGKLNKLITPKRMISGVWKEVLPELKDCLYTDDEYRADIASVLTIRLINYVENRFASNCEKKESDQIINRLTELCLFKEYTLLTEDLMWKMLRDLNTNYRSKCTKLMTNPEITLRIKS